MVRLSTGLRLRALKWMVMGLAWLITLPCLVAAAIPNLTWTQRSAGGGVLHGIAYGNDKFLVVGEGSDIYVSGDGVKWEKQARPTTNGLMNLAFGMGQFFALDSSSRLYGSSDGISWRSYLSAGPTARAMVVGDDRVAGIGVAGASLVWRAPDFKPEYYIGTNSHLRAIGYGSGEFVAAGLNGRIQWSPYGSNLVNAATAGVDNLSGIAFGANRFVAVGDGAVAMATDLTQWQARRLSEPVALRTVTYGNGLFVTAGSSGTNGQIWTSSDGLTWERSASGLPGNVVAIAAGKTNFVGITDGEGSYVSGSSNSWQMGKFWTDSDLEDAAFVQQSFVAVGPGGLIVNSRDGTLWAKQLSGSTDDLHCVRGGPPGPAAFIAAGNFGTMLVSSNGLTWTRVATGQMNHLYGLAWDGRRLLAVGGSGAVLTSADGLNWANESSGTAETLYGCAIGNGFKAVGARGTILGSPDGRTWTKENSGFQEDLRGIAYWKGAFYGVGENGLILRSVQTGIWTKLGSGTSANLFGLRSWNGMLFVAGANGTLLGTSTGDLFERLGNISSSEAEFRSIAAGMTAAGFSVLAVGHGTAIAQGEAPSSAVSASLPGVSHSVSSGQVPEMGGAATNYFARTGSLDEPLILRVDLYGNATLGQDYVIEMPKGGSLAAQQASVILPAGEPDATLIVRALPDNVLESTESVFLAIAREPGIFLANPTIVNIPIIDARPTLNISARDDTIWEPGGPLQETEITVTRTLLLDAMTLPLTISGTAINGVDYETVTNSIYFPQGATSVTFKVTARADNILEGSESIVFSLPGIGPDPSPVSARVNIEEKRPFSGIWTGGAASSLWTFSSLFGGTYAGGKFVLVGETTLLSSNAVDWSAPSGSKGTPMLGVTFGAGKFVACGIDGTFSSSRDGISWQTQVTGFTNWLYGITYGANKFVGAGENGLLLTSADGAGWRSVSSGTSSTIRRIIYGPGLFVAVGDRGLILTSVDGEQWEKRESGVSTSLYGACRGPDQFVVVGASGTVLRSADGTNWASQPAFTSKRLNAVIYAENQYFAGGDGLWSSPEGIGWGEVFVGPMDKWSGLPWINDLFAGRDMVLGVGPLTSIYQAGGPKAPASLIEFVMDKNVLLGNPDKIKVTITRTGLLSDNLPVNLRPGSAYPWLSPIPNPIMIPTGQSSATVFIQLLPGTEITNQLSASFTAGVPSGVALKGSSYFSITVVGNLPTVTVTSSVPGVLEGSEGTGQFIFHRTGDLSKPLAFNYSVGGYPISTLDYQPFPTRGVFQPGEADIFLPINTYADAILESDEKLTASISAGPGYIAGAPSDVIISNGPPVSGWSLLPDSLLSTNLPLTRLERAHSNLFAFTAGSEIVISANGTNWMRVQTSSPKPLRAAAYGEGLYVLGGDSGTLASSENLTNWQVEAGPGPESIVSIAFGARRFVAATSEGHLFVSDGGQQWRVLPGFKAANLRRIIYRNGIFVAAGDQIYSSVNGLTWTATPTSMPCTDAAFGQGWFVVSTAVGGAHALMISTNGVAWQRANSPGLGTISSLAYGYGAFLASGDLKGAPLQLDSTNGVQWPDRNLSAPTLSSDIFFRGRFYGLSPGGLIYRSAPFASLSISLYGGSETSELDSYGGGFGTQVSSFDSGRRFNIDLKYSGTATLGVDYEAPSMVSGPGAQGLIRPILDTELEGDETILIEMVPDYDEYEIRAAPPVLMKLKDAPGNPTSPVAHVTIESGVESIFRNSSSTVPITAFKLGRSGGNLAEPLVVKLKYGGSAKIPEDYSGANPYYPVPFLIFPAGTASVGIALVSGSSSGALGERLLTLEVVPSTGYTVFGSTSASVRILEVPILYRSVGNPFLFSVGWNQRINFNAGQFVSWQGGADFWDSGPNLLTSSNSVDWRAIKTPISRISTAIYANVGYIVFGTDSSSRSVVGKSFDGVSWEVRTVDRLSTVGSVAEGAGRLVAVGPKGLLTTSRDGLEWKSIDTSTLGTPSEVVWGNGKFLASGTKTIISDDGINWRVCFDQNIGRLSFGGGKFVAASDGYSPDGRRSYVSEDGFSWRYSDSGSMTNLQQLFYGGGRFVLFEGAGRLQSTDGEVWVADPVWFPFYYFNQYAYGNAVYVGVGGAGLGASPTFDSTQLLYSKTAKPLTVAWGPPGFVAAGNNGMVAFSPDGTSWIASRSPVRSNIYLAAYEAGEYLAVAEGGILLRSSDGRTWTDRRIPDLGTVRGLAAGGGLVVLIDSNGAITTVDNAGEHRFVPVPPALVLGSVAYGNGRFVVFGQQESFVSSDGINWTRFPGRRGFYVTFGNGQFLGGDINGQLSRSTDGVNWQPLSNPWSGTTNLVQPVFLSGQFVVRSGDSVFLSRDGQDWKQAPLQSSYVTSIALGAGRLVQLDSVGSIYYSTFALPNSPQPIVMDMAENGAGLSLRIRSDQVTPLIAESSSDLKTWAPMLSSTNKTGTMEFQVTPGEVRRFYRAKYGP